MTKFTFATTDEGFDNHIDSSIRGYSDLWNDVLKLSEYFIEDDTYVIDIGCSTGKLLRAMIDQNKSFAPDAGYIGIEKEQAFWNYFYSDVENPEYRGDICYYAGDVVNFQHDDDNYIYNTEFWGDSNQLGFNNSNLVTSIFTLQFMPVRDRQNVVNQIYNGLNVGGAFIVTEKMFFENPKFQDMFTFIYYDYKRKNFSADDILKKEKELRHMMKPQTINDLYEMLNNAGFEDENIQKFWQNHMFQGYIAIK